MYAEKRQFRIRNRVDKMTHHLVMLGCQTIVFATIGDDLKIGRQTEHLG
ncbi:Uncharacterised protein [Vibrio cholerae]|nr:Uncharacterised protein [Vibrio cholerae]